MPRGGRRQGTPGKAYSNRTDLSTGMKPVPSGGVDTTAAGGMTGSAPTPQGPPPMPLPAPEDSPMLFDETARPDEPVTAGLPIGPGPGPSRDTRAADTKKVQKYLPLIALYLDRPDTPDSVRHLYRYIRGA